MLYSDAAARRQRAASRRLAREASTAALAKARTDLETLTQLYDQGLVFTEGYEPAAAALREQIAFHSWVEDVDAFAAEYRAAADTAYGDSGPTSMFWDRS